MLAGQNEEETWEGALPSPTLLPFLRASANCSHPFIKKNNLSDAHSTQSTALDPGDVTSLDSQETQSDADRKGSTEARPQKRET